MDDVSDSPSDQGRLAAEKIAEQIQDLIIKQDLAEGERLPAERELARMLSTSRPTVSQAIRILVIRGLVESRRGSGAYVTRRPEAGLAATVNLMVSLNRESVQHLNVLRLALETTGIAQAIECGTEDELDAGAQALEQLRDSVGDTAAWMSADTRFHTTLVRASHNPYLSSIFESVHSTLIDYEYRTWIERGVVPQWLQSSEAAAVTALHEPILQAVVDRDEEAARVAVREHHDVMAQHLAASHE
ncbi:FadR family transcriptional regulator [Actinobacteria bacterium YIM 96077]|uniref:FadR family transcriptional regulator n=2 Tax=Phytoactinopolyspora halophila TaxID=1981511 RepID=A0A329QYL6_9ACTN|nr:FadR family transcriptional regulator [Actinobacteria bacterium YIM 96077]RAW17415.1 FadR family transcriptional regulator [Phytoactinopolyspora halophila]